jgi:hypothetical protein
MQQDPLQDCILLIWVQQIHKMKSRNKSDFVVFVSLFCHLLFFSCGILQVGYKAVDDFVRSGMKVGLGTGSTSYYAVERIGSKLKNGELKDIICVPTSEATKKQASSLGIPLTTLNELESSSSSSALDVSIDGADDIDLRCNLIKGGITICSQPFHLSLIFISHLGLFPCFYFCFNFSVSFLFLAFCSFSLS